MKADRIEAIRAQIAELEDEIEALESGTVQIVPLTPEERADVVARVFRVIYTDPEFA